MINERSQGLPVREAEAGARPGAAPSAQPLPLGATPAAVDVSVLDALVQQLDPDGTGLRDVLLGTYLDDSSAQIARLLVAVEGADLATVASIAHTVRSTSALLGANRLAHLLRSAEEATVHDPGLVPAIACDIDAEFARVAECLQDLRRQPVVAAPG